MRPEQSYISQPPNQQISFKPWRRIGWPGALLLLALWAMPNIAQGWTHPQRIIESSAIPFAVVSGSNIYIVSWANNDFDFVSSTDIGLTWSNPIQPADTMYGPSLVPDITCTPNGLIHVVWRGQYQEIPWATFLFHQSSSDGGRHWSRRHKLFNSSSFSPNFPRVAAKGDTLFSAFSMDYRLVALRSFNSGLTWRDSTTVDSFGDMMQSPVMLYSQGRLHLVYPAGFDDVGYQICYSRSDDLGLTWTPRIYLSYAEPPYWASQCPSAYADINGNIVSFWFDFRFGSACGGWTGDIVGKISTDNGDSWLPETRLTYTQTADAPGCTIANDSVYAVWADGWPMGCNNPKIEIASSPNWGTSWSEPEVITGRARNEEHNPFICSTTDQATTYIHCFYGIFDDPVASGAYYIRNKPFKSNRMPLPGPQPVILKLKAYPNVFNSATMIFFENSEGGDVELAIFNILGQKIWCTKINGKEGNIIWDAKDNEGNSISSGTYFVRAATDKNVATTKILYLK